MAAEIVRNDWHSPPKIIESARSVLGTIDLDPSSCAKANENVRATAFYTPQEDGLSRPWFGRVWFAPPYGRGHLDMWVAKLMTEYESGAVTEAIGLLPWHGHTKWFERLGCSPICCIRGRLRFSGAGTAPFPSIVVYLGPNIDHFAEVFGSWGRVWRRYGTVTKCR
jgi:hypothetical protein